MEIKLFSKWRPSAILNLRKLPFWSSDRYLHVILHLHSEICINRPIWSRDIAKKRFSIWRPSAILNLKNFDFFVTFACSEWKFVSVYQIWSKSDNSRPRYGDKAIFKMAAVRHLEFAKIAVLVMWRISACDPSFLFQISRWLANMSPRYSQKTIFNMASIRHLEFAKFRFFVKCPS